MILASLTWFDRDEKKGGGGETLWRWLKDQYWWSLTFCTKKSCNIPSFFLLTHSHTRGPCEKLFLICQKSRVYVQNPDKWFRLEWTRSWLSRHQQIVFFKPSLLAIQKIKSSWVFKAKISLLSFEWIHGRHSIEHLNWSLRNAIRTSGNRYEV